MTKLEELNAAQAAALDAYDEIKKIHEENSND
jgi:hypothetical protein